VILGVALAIGKGRQENALLLATVEPTWPQRRLALALGLGLLVVSGATAPFSAMPLPQIYTVVSALLAICFLSDLITAVLLFSQFSIIRSRALHVLASGYFFAALIVIPFGLTYPRLFSPTGLLGAGLQTASWLYLAWHFGFPAAVFSYTFLKDSTHAVPDASVKSAIGWSVALIPIFVCALTLLFTAGNDFVPRLALNETTLSPLVPYLGMLLVLFTAIAFTSLWMRQRSVLDQWLLIATLAFLLETVLSNVLTPARFSVGFYAGVVLLLFNATIVMVILLTETTRLYARIIRSNNALQREQQNKLSSLEAIVASISHEVRQPLGAVLTNSETAVLSLKHTPPDIEIAMEALHEIERDVHRTTEIFKSIGTLFGRTDQQLVSIDINDVVAETLRIMGGEIEERGIKAQVDLKPRLPHIMGHRGQLQEVVINLIHNGIEAMSAIESREKRLLTIVTQFDDYAVTLAVRDTGLGIEPDKMNQVFDAFITTKPLGMGLGLSICRRIIERHGGQISAWSAGEQKGAVFQLTLPITPTSAVAAGYAGDRQQAQQAPQALSSPHAVSRF
jgi:signal transduction histidine kinase